MTRGPLLALAVCTFSALAAFGAEPAAGAGPKAARPRLYVSQLAAQGATAQQAAAFTDAVISALNERKLFDIVSTNDVATLVSAERQKQVLGGCGSGDCSLDVGALVNARFVLSGALSQVGSAYQLSLQTVDTEKGQPVGRSTRLSGDLESLTRLVPYAAAEATGSPLPPPPSRVLQVSMMVAGGGAVVAGGVVGLLALSRQAQLNEELCPSGTLPGERCTGSRLAPRDAYVQRDAELAGQKALSLSLMIGGAALATAGFLLLPASPRDGAAVAFVPSANGAALVGVFP